MLGASFYVPWLVFNLIALVPLLHWLEQNERAGRWYRARGAILAGLACHLISTSFVVSLSRFSPLAWLLYPAFALVLALKIGLIATLASSLRRRTGLPWVWTLPTVWVAIDWLLTFGDLRMPGDHLYHTMSSYPFVVQFADVLGPYGVSAAVLVVNVLIYEASIHWPQRRARRSAVALGAMLVVVLGYDAYAWTRERPADATLRVGIVQPNVEMLLKWDQDANQAQWEKLARLSREAVDAGAELLVWPETAVPWPVYHWLDRPDTFAAQPVEQLSRSLGVPILAGVEYVRVRTQDDYDLFNAAMVFTPDGGLHETWSAKAYLVPFTEKMPFSGLLGRFIGVRAGQVARDRWHGCRGAGLLRAAVLGSFARPVQCGGRLVRRDHQRRMVRAHPVSALSGQRRTPAGDRDAPRRGALGEHGNLRFRRREGPILRCNEPVRRGGDRARHRGAQRDDRLWAYRECGRLGRAGWIFDHVGPYIFVIPVNDGPRTLTDVRG
jgi:apolipoprotein N-acyltransferase